MSARPHPLPQPGPHHIAQSDIEAGGGRAARRLPTAVTSTQTDYGVDIYGPYTAYNPINSHVIYDGLSRRAGTILQRLVEDERLELISSVAGRGDQVVPHGTFELVEPRREAGPRTEFGTRPPVVGKRDREILVRIQPTQAALNSRERFVLDQGDETNRRVFVERSLTEEREARVRRV